MDKQCEKCFYYDKCNANEVCEDYTPLGEYAEDEYIDKLIENRRIEFHKEWFSYIEQNAD